MNFLFSQSFNQMVFGRVTTFEAGEKMWLVSKQINYNSIPQEDFPRMSKQYTNNGQFEARGS